MQSLIGLGSGHIYGEGLGGGQAQWGFLPNAHTDFIFSVIGEELGIIGALVVLALLGALLWLGIRAATQAPDRFGALLALGLVAWVGAETLINVGAVVGVLPVTGIPLPFISFGGSSLVITMAAAGVLINVARQGEAGARSDRRAGWRRAKSRGSAGHRTHGVHGVHGGHRGAVAASTRRPAAPEVGERTARHGDRGRRDGRSHRPLTADRPRARGARAPGRHHRALRVAAGAGGHHVACARIPLHAAARTRAAAEHAPCGLVGQRRCRGGARVGLRPRAGFLRLPAAAGGRHRRGLRELSRRSRSGRHPGPARLREHRRRARGGQRAARALRRGQRRGVRRDGSPADTRHRDTGPPRSRLVGRDAGGPGTQQEGARPAR